ncbi:sensor histidine kinase [Roseateles sp. PN1]|uniref:sensor histidine kinase n=1 Tax=Roseateles sp. PN1 TaxID=3137372 RepID=UPI0031397B8D
MSWAGIAIPADLLGRALRQARLVLIIALVAAGLVSMMWRQPFLLSFIFCLCISISCSALIQSLSAGATYLINRLRPEHLPRATWPGWPLMIICLVLGTSLGFSLGNLIGEALTGLHTTGLYSGNWRQGLIMLAVSLLPGVLATNFFVNRSRLQAAQVQAQTAQRLAAENQLRLLESQLEPHMLFNTLATLRVLIGSEPQRAQAMLDQLIAFLRATLTASRSGSHPLRDEFARLQDYLALMQIRMGARLQPRLELPAELADLPVPPLLLQPLVENAIKHGLEPSLDGGELRISASLSGTPEARELLLQVQDGGLGYQPSAFPRPSGSGFGLHQVRERLLTQFGPQASLTIAALPAPASGTLASIRLPLPAKV